ncbi:MAG: BON domain-containing protein [Anaerolineales bacterium]
MTNAALQDLQLEVEEALWQYAPVRDALGVLRIEARPDGKVEIAGPVRSGSIKDGILATVRRLPGVAGVIDRLLPDPELELAIARAIDTDPSLKALPPGSVSVYSHLGQVSLVGKTPTEPVRRRAVEVARGVPGVRRLVDRLR